MILKKALNGKVTFTLISLLLDTLVCLRGYHQPRWSVFHGIDSDSLALEPLLKY